MTAKKAALAPPLGGGSGSGVGGSAEEDVVVVVVLGNSLLGEANVVSVVYMDMTEASQSSGQAMVEGKDKIKCTT